MQASKRLKTTSAVNGTAASISIGTHNGHFHADEALAVYMLRILPDYHGSSLVRTRDPSLLEQCHTVVDVGGEYSPQNNRYDHHQRSFDTTFPGRATKLSSAGLVYMHFGRDIVQQQLHQAQPNPSSDAPPADDEVGMIWRKLYEEFIEALDANDNGISVYDSTQLVAAGVSKRFNDTSVNLGSLVSDLNYEFNDDVAEQRQSVQEQVPNQERESSSEQATTSQKPSQTAEDARFLRASSLMGVSFLRKLSYYCRAWLPARKVVQEAFTGRFHITQQNTEMASMQGRIMLLPRPVPWKDHLYTLESEELESAGKMGDSDIPKVLYVLYPESEQVESSTKWRVQAVAVSKDSFESRKALPLAWRGLRDEELSSKAGIPGCIFVHASGFIGGNTSREGALRMAFAAAAT